MGLLVGRIRSCRTMVLCEFSYFVVYHASVVGAYARYSCAA